MQSANQPELFQIGDISHAVSGFFSKRRYLLRAVGLIPINSR